MESIAHSSSVAGEPRVGIFWDYESCPPQTNVPGYTIAEHIQEMAHRFGPVSTFKAYLEHSTTSITPKTLRLRSELQTSGVSFTDCPREAHRKMLLVDMLTFAIDNAAPAVIMLISDDRDFVYALSILRQRKYDVALVTPPQGVHITLKHQATHVLEWKYDIFAEKAPPLHSDSDDDKLSSNADVPSSSYGKKPNPTTPSRTMSLWGPPLLQENNDNGRQFSSNNVRSPSGQPALPQTPLRRASQAYDMPSALSPAPSLNPGTRPTTTATATTPGRSGNHPTIFNRLVEILEEQRALGHERPLRSQIGMMLVKKNPMLYATLGVKSFSDYVRAAEKAGVVKLGATGVIGQDWMALAET